MNVMMEIRDQEMAVILLVESKEDGLVQEEIPVLKMYAPMNVEIGGSFIMSIVMMETILMEMDVLLDALKNLDLDVLEELIIGEIHV